MVKVVEKRTFNVGSFVVSEKQKDGSWTEKPVTVLLGVAKPRITMTLFDNGGSVVEFSGKTVDGSYVKAKAEEDPTAGMSPEEYREYRKKSADIAREIRKR